MKDKFISFGSNFKSLRKKYGYTRDEIAGMLSYSLKTIEKWEYGKSVPPLETLCEICKIFNVTLDSLVYEDKREVKYFLGIDGGGTKTEFLVTDADVKEINRIILGPSNPVDIGMDKTFQILEQGITECCKNIDLREVSAFAGLAGGITGNNQKIINEFLSKYNFASFSNGSDIENVLELSLKGKSGVSVVMGTGVIAYSQYNNKRLRIGGWGYHIDKGGSGYNIASDGMYSAFKFIDGRKGSRILCELFENKLGKKLPDAVSQIYAGGKSYIASFAPLVFEAYRKGDEFAIKIIEDNIKEVAEIIETGLKNIPDKDKNVVVCGGLVASSDVIKPVLEKYFRKNINISFSGEPVVNGAVMLAKKESKKC